MGSAAVDYLADYNAAQASGHHPDCDGYRTAHRVELVRTDIGTWQAVCEEHGTLHPGSFAQRYDAEHFAAGHAHEVPCDGRCRAWTTPLTAEPYDFDHTGLELAEGWNPSCC